MGIEKSTIYTKGGDQGKTSLLGGRRVSKFHQKIEAYGTIDELMAHTALLRETTDDERIKEQLLVVLDKLMSAASLVASDGKNLPDNMPEISEKDVLFLEEAIDVMDHDLTPLRSFILPGGNISSSQAHIVRTVCRRAERNILKLHKTESVDDIIIKYFNRLSDYYFVLSRMLTHLSGAPEIPWKP